MKWYCSGDFHGQIPYEFTKPLCEDEQSAILIVGDSGVNYYGEGSKKDTALKKLMNESGNIFYLIRGNHDAPPEALSKIEMKYDEEVGGPILCEPEYPNIRYFKRWGVYTIDGFRCAVVAGAYSVDKEYRLMRGWNWFADEQLTSAEKAECMAALTRESAVDLILAHTCPLSWMPTDKFLPFIDQSKVDKGMEEFLEEVKNNINFKYFVAGHYHVDRWQNEKMRFLYNDVTTLQKIMEGCKNDNEI